LSYVRQVENAIFSLFSAKADHFWKMIQAVTLFVTVCPW